MKNENVQPQINKIRNRLLYLSPTVQAGLEPECKKNDFFQEGGKALGKGAFGEVWKVTHKTTQKQYVIKVIKKKLIVDNKLVNQMNLEIEIMYKLYHPHIIKLVNHFEDDDCFYLILNYAAKGQLYSFLQKQKRFDERTAAQYFRETVLSVQFIHSFNPPIIHRDIKPENILLDEDGRVKLADFGWSNFANEQIRKTLCGTPEYLAPEMLGKTGHDTSVDVWSLGILLYEFLTGYSPFKGKTQDEVYSNIRRFKIVFPDDFPLYAKDLVQKILKQKPSDRLKTNEILEHTWLQKNEPLKPYLQVVEKNQDEILMSRIINIPEDKLNQLEAKISKNKQIISNIRMSSLTSTTTNNTNVSNSNDQISVNESQIKQLLEQANNENHNLKKEVVELKSKIQGFESESKTIKGENLKLVKQLEDSSKNKDELEKLKVINKDRLVLLTEIEEKNNENSDLKNKLRSCENESFNYKKEAAKLSEQLKDINRLYESSELKNTNLRNQVENLLKENSSLSSQYQNKIEILQAKMFEKLAPDDNSASDKMNSLIMDSIGELKILFKSKTDNLHSVLAEIKEHSENVDVKFEKMVSEKNNYFIDTLHKVKSSFDNDMIQIKMKLGHSSKGDERQEWLKKQINELMGYKLKSIKLEGTITKLEERIEILTHKVNDSSLQTETNKKIASDLEIELKVKKDHISSLEAKLGDVKDFVFQNCKDKLEDLQKLML